MGQQSVPSCMTVFLVLYVLFFILCCFSVICLKKKKILNKKKNHSSETLTSTCACKCTDKDRTYTYVCAHGGILTGNGVALRKEARNYMKRRIQPYL